MNFRYYAWGLLLILTAEMEAQTISADRMSRRFSGEAEFVRLQKTETMHKAEDEFLYSVGDRYPSSLDMVQDGQKVELPDGSTIYRLAFTAPKARFMDISYKQFQMPAGGYLYLYQPATRAYQGPYTSEGISDSLGFSTDLLEGDSIELLCYEPRSGKGQTRIALHCVIAGQKAFFNSDETPSCLINTACEEAQAYRDIVQSVVLIYMDGYLCSGTLINNTARDGTPYILTAAHCMEDISYPQTGSWKFYFNIQSASCQSNTDGPSLYGFDLQEITGCKIVSKGEYSDFMLLQLNQQIPDSYRAYYCGWDRRNSAPNGVVGIHHPMGDYKKFSRSSQTPTTTNCSAVGYNRMAFWYFSWDRGIAFPGSSGSGLFNASTQRLIGTLTAINNVGCSESPKYRNNWYGKLSYHWFANNENKRNEQLKPWLDPIGSGALYMDGSYRQSLGAAQTLPQAGHLEISPNPSDGKVVLNGPWQGSAEGEVYSMTGQKVGKFQLSQAGDATDLSSLSEGIYLILLKTAQGMYRGKLHLLHP